MDESGQYTSKPAPAARPSGIPRMSRLPVLKPTNANASPQPRTLRTAASTSMLSSTTKIERPATVRRGLGGAVRSRQSRDLGLTSPLEDVFKKPVAQPSRSSRERTATTSSGGSTVDGDRSTFRSSSSLSNTGTTLSDENAPVARPKKGPRPSLSDRTIESLANIPASPKVRRRSSFFAPQSPMTNSRPSSSLANHGRQPSRDVLGQGFPTPRPASPSKGATINRPPSGHTPARNLRGSVSGSRTVGAVKTPKSKPGLEGLFAKQSASVKPTRSTYSSAQKALKPPADAPETPRKVSTSSAALREQIRLAKQTHRNSPKRIGEEDFFPNYDLVTDPFNQAPDQKVSALSKRINDARLQGRLDISGMGFKQVPKEVMSMYEFKGDAAQDVNWSEFVDLTRFVAADNEFDQLPEDLFPDNDMGERPPQFPCVEYLDLHGNLLGNLSLGMRKLENLTVLNVSRNRLTNDAFDVISEMTNLKELKLAENLLEGRLPETVGHLEKLEVLELQSNKLTSLPDTTQQLKDLRVLNVANNKLTRLPLELLESIPLTELIATRNILSGTLFSSSVACLPKLQTLDVSFNELTALSAGNLYLPLLRIINVSANRLVSLPTMTSWTSLTTIVAEDNSLTEFPAGFTELQSVKSANFNGNDIRKLDPQLARMDGLDRLDISGNPMGESRFLSMSTEEVKRVLRGRLAAPAIVDPLVEMMQSMGQRNFS